MPGARRGFDPVSHPMALSLCPCPALPVSPAPGIYYGARYADLRIMPTFRRQPLLQVVIAAMESA